MVTFEMKRLGFNEREIQLLLLTLNGLAYNFPGLPTAQWLSHQIGSQIEVCCADIEEFGEDLATKERNPELPFEYQDLFEKVAKLNDGEAASVVYFASGFFAGRSFSPD